MSQKSCSSDDGPGCSRGSQHLADRLGRSPVPCRHRRRVDVRRGRRPGMPEPGGDHRQRHPGRQHLSGDEVSQIMRSTPLAFLVLRSRRTGPPAASISPCDLAPSPWSVRAPEGRVPISSRREGTCVRGPASVTRSRRGCDGPGGEVRAWGQGSSPGTGREGCACRACRWGGGGARLRSRWSGAP